MQNGATSIVGQCIIQLARIRGVHSINIIRDRCRFAIFKFIASFLSASFSYIIMNILQFNVVFSGSTNKLNTSKQNCVSYNRESGLSSANRLLIGLLKHMGKCKMALVVDTNCKKNCLKFQQLALQHLANMAITHQLGKNLSHWN